MIAPIYLLVGLLVGAAQARSLARAAQYGHGLLGLLLRLTSVAALLWVAARNGQLLAAGVAWAAGFVLMASVMYRRL